MVATAAFPGRSWRREPDMMSQDASDFEDRGGVLLHAMIGTDHQFGLDIFEMRTEVRDDAIGPGLDRSGPQSADDRVKRGLGIRLHHEHRLEDRRAGVERFDARGHPPELSRIEGVGVGLDQLGEETGNVVGIGD